MGKQYLIPIVNQETGEIRGYQVMGEPDYCGGGCGKEHLLCGNYMVTDELWEKHGNKDGMICLPCFESMVGRALTSADFKLVPINIEILHILKRFENAG